MSASSRTLIVVVFSLSLVDVLALCPSTEVQPGFLFSCELRRDDIFSAVDVAKGDTEVEFSASVAGHAGLPRWLSVLQVNRLSPAYIFGTPAINDIGNITLEVSAIRMDTFETVTREVVISITNTEGNIQQGLRAEFYITNYNTNEFLSPVVLETFADVVVQIFQHPKAHIIQVIQPSFRGIAVPPSPAKHGVIVVVTPGPNVHSIALATDEQARVVQGQCGADRVYTNPPAKYSLFTVTNININWCQFQLFEVEGNRSEVRNATDPDPTLPAVPHSESSGNFAPLVAIVVICFVVVVVLVTGMACCFFWGRKHAWYMSHKRQVRKAKIVKHTKEISHGPTIAQKYIRNLAQVPHQRLTGSGLENEVPGSREEILEFQDVTDYGSPATEGKPPPSYTYPESLLSLPLKTELL